MVERGAWLATGGSRTCGGMAIPRGGAQSLTNALCRYLATLGGTVKTSSRVESLSAVEDYDLILCDVIPRQLLKLAGERLSDRYKRRLQIYRYGPGVFKVDYALHAPIPWKAPGCSRAATVHLGGSFEEIAASEQAVRQGRHADRPFVLLAQPSLFDSSRAPQGKHTAWAYCHVPHGSNTDEVTKLEDQIERFAPEFRDCVAARKVFSPADLEQNGCQPHRRRHRRRSDGHPPVSVPPHMEALRHLGERHLHLLLIHSTGRRRAWNVRLPCGNQGVSEVEAQ